MTHTWPTAWHLGSVHSVEQALILVLLLAPFLALWIVSVVRRRQDARLADEAAGPESSRTGVPTSRSGLDREL